MAVITIGGVAMAVPLSVLSLVVVIASFVVADGLLQCLCLMPAEAQSNGLAQTGPSAPQAPPPSYETPKWSQQPHQVSFTNSFSSSALQQLWLDCPDSLSQLLTPAASLGLSTHPKSNSHAHDRDESQKPMYDAISKLASALQQQIQMLACGNSNASIAILHDLTEFLEAYHLQKSAVLDPSKVPANATAAHASNRLLNPGMSHHTADAAQVQAAEQPEASEAASGATASAALQVVAVLIAHDKACQQMLMQSVYPAKVSPQVTH